MLLTRECSIWRAVALTSLLIWARLHISLSGNPASSPSYGALSDVVISKRYLENDGTPLPGGKGLIDAVWYMPPLDFDFLRS